MKIKNVLLTLFTLGLFACFSVNAKSKKKRKKNKNKIEKVEERRPTVKEWDTPAIRGKRDEARHSRAGIKWDRRTN